jgi:hypothetical protein
MVAISARIVADLVAERHGCNRPSQRWPEQPP